MTHSEQVETVVMDVLRDHNVKLDEFKSGRVKPGMKEAAAVIEQKGVMFSRCYLEQYMGITERRFNTLINHAH